MSHRWWAACETCGNVWRVVEADSACRGAGTPRYHRATRLKRVPSEAGRALEAAFLLGGITAAKEAWKQRAHDSLSFALAKDLDNG